MPCHYVRIRKNGADGELVAEKSCKTRKAAEALGRKIADDYQVPNGCVVCVESSKAKPKANGRISAAQAEKLSDKLGGAALIWNRDWWLVLEDMARGARISKDEYNYARVAAQGDVRRAREHGLPADVIAGVERLATYFAAKSGKSKAKAKANPKSRFTVFKSESIDGGTDDFAVYDNELDDAVGLFPSKKEAQEIAALLRAYHGARTSPHVWEEARERLLDAGIELEATGARANPSWDLFPQPYIEPTVEEYKAAEKRIRAAAKAQSLTGKVVFRDGPYFDGSTWTASVDVGSHNFDVFGQVGGAIQFVQAGAARPRANGRKNPHIPTGSKIIAARGVLAHSGWTVGPYQSATGAPAFAVIAQGAQVTGPRSLQVFADPKAAMQAFTAEVGKPNVYKAIQDYQIRKGQRVGVQVRGNGRRKNGSRHADGWDWADEQQARSRSHRGYTWRRAGSGNWWLVLDSDGEQVGGVYTSEDAAERAARLAASRNNPRRHSNPPRGSLRDFATNSALSLAAAQEIDLWRHGVGEATPAVKLLAKAVGMPKGADPGFWAGELFDRLIQASGHNPKVVEYIGFLVS